MVLHPGFWTWPDFIYPEADARGSEFNVSPQTTRKSQLTCPRRETPLFNRLRNPPPPLSHPSRPPSDPIRLHDALISRLCCSPPVCSPGGTRRASRGGFTHASRLCAKPLDAAACVAESTEHHYQFDHHDNCCHCHSKPFMFGSPCRTERFLSH